MAGASNGAISSTSPTEVSTRAASRPLKWSRTEAAAITTVAPPPSACTTRSRYSCSTLLQTVIARLASRNTTSPT